jgi:predicted nucleotide-binding protein
LAGEGAIKNMVCVPISLRQGSEFPFGVACFHNNNENKKFSKSDIQTLEAYVDVLALALHMPQPEIQLDKKVFIVHGRDAPALHGLAAIIEEAGVTAEILRRGNRGALLILEALERILKTCNAGFILVTPDDEGRLAPAEEAQNEQRSKEDDIFEPRARENVIFETGLLFARFRESERVSVLLKKPARLPSDLGGMWVEHFTDIGELAPQIKDRLRHWGMLEPVEGSGPHQR